MEKLDQNIETTKPKSVEEAVQCFQDDKTEATIKYLRENRNDIGEFCLQVKECYSENDMSTPFLRLAELIDKLL